LRFKDAKAPVDGVPPFWPAPASVLELRLDPVRIVLQAMGFDEFPSLQGILCTLRRSHRAL
jgi:hypothetical protein